MGIRPGKSYRQMGATWPYNGLPAVVRGRQVAEGAEVTPHPARDGW